MFTAWLWMYFWIKRRWILTWYIKASPQASITCKVDLHVPDIKSPWLISKNWCCWVLQLQYISLWIKCPLCSAFHLLPTWEAASLSSQVTEMRWEGWRGLKAKAFYAATRSLEKTFMVSVYDPFETSWMGADGTSEVDYGAWSHDRFLSPWHIHHHRHAYLRHRQLTSTHTYHNFCASTLFNVCMMMGTRTDIAAEVDVFRCSLTKQPLVGYFILLYAEGLTHWLEASRYRA